MSSGNKKLKRLVRERMERTGERYTTALAAIQREHAASRGQSTEAPAPPTEAPPVTPR
ncbi:hypothetical protein ACN28E_25025 [Archangium lansingense]|uniref:hypothetical protein n=1 Tax=Archangium lansingense TaxID=2995310 RepID=UPI003B76978E